MITSIIVWGSLFAAVAFTVVYLLSPRVRAQVEQPKHQFQRQLESFDNSTAQEPKRGQQ